MEKVIELIKASLEEVKVPEPYTYYELFLKKKQEAVASSDQILGDVFSLLAGIFSMYYQFGSNISDPFGALMVMTDGKRTFLPGDLTDAQIETVETLLNSFDEPVFTARLGDVLWLKAKKYPCAKRAVAAYLASAKADKDESWLPKSDYLRRAATIAAELGRDSEEKNLVLSAILEFCEKYKTDCFEDLKTHGPSSLVKIILETKLPADFSALGNDCLNIAKRFQELSNHSAAQKYFERAEKCFRMAKDNLNADKTLYAAAGEVEAQAQKAIAEGNGLRMMYHIQRAIKAYQGISGAQNKVKELEKELEKSNFKTLEQMSPVEIRIDVQELVNQARTAMSGKDGKEGLMQFALLHQPQSFQNACTIAEQINKEHPLQAIVTSSVLSPEGNVVAKKPDFFSDPEAAKIFGAIRLLNQGQDLAGGVTLEAARKELIKSPEMAWQEAVKELLQGHPVVPQERVMIFDRAICAGLQGDGLIFMHLIIPQLEHFLRVFLEKNGVRTSSMPDADGIQEEYDLNRLLREESVVEILGEDLVWEMRSFLTEKSGPNLRNRLCHGLLPPASCEGGKSNFLLWLTLYFLFSTKQ